MKILPSLRGEIFRGGQNRVGKDTFRGIKKLPHIDTTMKEGKEDKR